MLLYFYFDVPFNLKGFLPDFLTPSFLTSSEALSSLTVSTISSSGFLSGSFSTMSVSESSSSSNSRIDLNSVLNFIPSLASKRSVSPIRSSSFFKFSLILISSSAISAFLVSLVVIKKLMGWVKKHTFEGFGYYRICLGALIVVLFCCNVIA